VIGGKICWEISIPMWVEKIFSNKQLQMGGHKNSNDNELEL
jgi:hypothetical protein